MIQIPATVLLPSSHRSSPFVQLSETDIEVHKCTFDKLASPVFTLTLYISRVNLAFFMKDETKDRLSFKSSDRYSSNRMLTSLHRRPSYRSNSFLQQYGFFSVGAKTLNIYRRDLELLL
jgi:hypothetical protein